MAELGKMTAEELDAEETALRVELAAIMERPYFEREARHGNRVLTIHYKLNYIEWAKAGKPQPTPRFL